VIRGSEPKKSLAPDKMKVKSIVPRDSGRNSRVPLG
jgi:hypothetical protein